LNLRFDVKLWENGVWGFRFYHNDVNMHENMHTYIYIYTYVITQCKCKSLSLSLYIYIYIYSFIFIKLLSQPLIQIYIYIRIYKSNCYRNLEKQAASCRAGFPVEAAARIAKR